MPDKPQRPCRKFGCGKLVKGDGWCDAHRPEPFTGCADRNRKRTFTGRPLQRLRQSWFKHSPLCVECLSQGRTAAAQVLDHIIPLHAGGLDDIANMQGLCIQCHNDKSMRERLALRRSA